MGPKPRPAYKTPPKVDDTTAASASKNQQPIPPQVNMPPPPDSKDTSYILEPEMCALMDSLKKAAITTGQIFKFYSDAKRNNVLHFVPRPPRSLTNTLGTELGRYDQICDTLDSHIARSVAVLQRDLNIEEARLKEEEDRKALEKAAEQKAAEISNSLDVDMPQAEPLDFKKPNFPPIHASGALAGPTNAPARRQSKISLSTLHRSQFPLKLDLSSASLRMSADEAGMVLTALPSPVLLAPKSAKPVASDEIPPELLAAFTGQSQGVGIDLTLPDLSQSSDLPGSRRVSDDLGNSAEKPIDLDIDLDSTMSDLFGDGSEGEQHVDVDVESLFNTGNMSTGNVSGIGDMPVQTNQDSEMGGIFDAISGAQSQRDTEAMFASLQESSEGSALPGAERGASNAAPPLSSSILATLTASAGPQGISTTDSVVPAGDVNINDPQPYYGDLDMSNLGTYFNTKEDDESMLTMARLLGAEASNTSTGATTNSTNDSPQKADSSG